MRRAEALVLLRPNKQFRWPDLARTGQRHFEAGDLLHRSFAEPRDLEAVRRFAQTHGLRVLSVNTRTRTMVVRGPEAALARLKKLTPVRGVFGLDDHPTVKRPGRQKFPPEESLIPPPVTPNTRPPKDFRDLYHFPKHATGEGQFVGVLEFGGGFRRHKLRSYLQKLGVPLPRIIVREIPPAKNQPASRMRMLSPDAEVYQDLEVLASVAPHATLVVYFAENSTRGWMDALDAAIFDPRYPLSVLSISWGQAETQWDRAAIQAIDHRFQMAGLLGITVCCSSGDRGVFEDGARPYTVPFPASSPHVLACGGTQLDVLSGGRTRETVWNQSHSAGVVAGGGLSSIFALPPFQKGHGVAHHSHARSPGRGIPDVAANASSTTGYLIWADDIAMSLGGTSASAPLWAGLVACLNQALGRRIGYLTPLLYGTKPHPGLRGISEGNNRMEGRQGYDARKNWDPCTGLGTPHGDRLLKWLRQVFDREY